MIREQPPEPFESILDAVRTQRVPVSCRIDRDHRLGEFLFQPCRQTQHAEVRADLNNGVDIVTVQFGHRIADSRFIHLGDGGPAGTTQAGIANGLDAVVSQKTDHFPVGHRIIG